MQELLERMSMIMRKSMSLQSDKIDFSKLIADTLDSNAILQSLIDSTLNDIIDFKKAADNGNREEVLAIIHRIRPIWDMLAIPTDLQSLKNAVKDRNTTTFEIKQLTEDVIIAMKGLIET